MIFTPYNSTVCLRVTKPCWPPATPYSFSRAFSALHVVPLPADLLPTSSCSPDFGVGGVVDRLGQISPKMVFFSLGYLYGGRWHDCRKLALDVLARLPGERL